MGLEPKAENSLLAQVAQTPFNLRPSARLTKNAQQGWPAQLKGQEALQGRVSVIHVARRTGQD